MLTSLDHSQIAHYLLSLGLVKPRAVIDEDLTVVDVSRRNAVFLASTSNGPSYVVKQSGQAGPDPLRREAAVLSQLACDPALADLIPKLVHFDRDATRLVLRTPAGGREWGGERRFSCRRAGALGRALAAVRGASVEVAPLPEDDERLWGVTLPEPSLDRLRSFSAGARDLLRRVQADEPLCARLRELSASAEGLGFVHGDVRWENCLAVAAPGGRRRTRLLLIDWERAGPGRPELDVAGALAEYLRAWVDSMPNVQPSTDFARLGESARRPLTEVTPATGALWRAYRAGRPSTTAEKLEIAELTAVRLLEIAFESARGAPFATGHLVVLVQVAASILASPGYAAWNHLGLVC